MNNKLLAVNIEQVIDPHGGEHTSINLVFDKTEDLIDVIQVLEPECVPQLMRDLVASGEIIVH